MTPSEPARWLVWAREIQALSQTGLTYSDNDFDTQRYQRLQAIAAEIVEEYAHFPAEEVMEDFIAQPGYATPKVDVRGAAVRDGRILLVQERSDGLWCMPGGWADVGELPSSVVVREVWEESGFDVEPRKVLGVYDANRGGSPLSFYHAYKIIFLCELAGGHARPSNETVGVGFYGFDRLPSLSTNRTDVRHLAEVRAHLADPGRLAAFD